VRAVDLARIDTDVVDADPLVVRHVVEHRHPALPDDRRAPDLVRVEPADMHERVGRRELQPQVRDVLVPRADVALSPYRHRDRQLVEQVRGDRDVVRRQVPDDVHVPAVEAEAEPRRVDREHPPELACADELAQLPHRRVVLEGVAHHQLHLGGRGRGDELLGVRDLRGQRFLDENVLTRVQGTQPDPHVGRRRRGHEHRVHPVQRRVEVASDHPQRRAEDRSLP
jgi:hypothetical protein